MTVQQTFTCHVTVRNLCAALLDDENQGYLPSGFAMRLTMAMLRHDAAELANMHAEMAAAGWRCVMADDLDEAEPFKLACNYINTAARILAE